MVIIFCDSWLLPKLLWVPPNGEKNNVWSLTTYLCCKRCSFSSSNLDYMSKTSQTEFNFSPHSNLFCFLCTEQKLQIIVFYKNKVIFQSKFQEFSFVLSKTLTLFYLISVVRATMSVLLATKKQIKTDCMKTYC